MTVLAIVGPTAVGKSDVAVEIAIRVGGEIVNADSMQLYRGMDIGTAKLPMAERRGVPHHLLDIWPVTYPANVAEYQRLAREVIDEIHARGHVAIVVGGSGLYIQGALDAFAFPGTDPSLRDALQAEADQVGADAMHARLAQVDPVAAAAILPGNVRRVIRALEVITLTGGTFTATLPEPTAALPTRWLGLRRTREELDQRIARRVDTMWEHGLVDEVRGLELQGLRSGVTASRALGYAQVLAMLDGHLTAEQARDETVRATRRFARRQESWFGRDHRIHWFDNAADLVNAVAA